MEGNSTVGVIPTYPALVATFTLYSLPLVVGVAGNAVIVYIVASTKSLRTGVNAYIANMAALDLLACCMLVPLRMAFYTMDMNKQHSLDVLCRADVFFRSVTDSGRVILLSALSFERYQTVARPFQRDKAAAARRAVITLCVVWCAILVLAALMSCFLHDTVTFEICSISGHETYGTWGSIEMFVVLPLSLATVCVVLVCYTLMFRMLYEQRQKMLKHSLKPKHKVSPAPEPAPPPPDPAQPPVPAPFDSPAKLPVDPSTLPSQALPAQIPPNSSSKVPPDPPKIINLAVGDACDESHVDCDTLEAPAYAATCDTAAGVVVVTEHTDSALSLPCTPPYASKQIALKSLTAFASAQSSMVTLLQCDSESNVNYTQTRPETPESPEKKSEKGTISSGEWTIVSPYPQTQSISVSPHLVCDNPDDTLIENLNLNSSQSVVHEKDNSLALLSPTERPLTAACTYNNTDDSPVFRDRPLATLKLPSVTGFRGRSHSVPNAVRSTLSVPSVLSVHAMAQQKPEHPPRDTVDGLYKTEACSNTSPSQPVTGEDAPSTSKGVKVVEMDGTVHVERLDNAENIQGDVCVLSTKNRLQGRRRVEGRVAKRLVVLFLTFILLWLPFPIVVLYFRVNHFTPNGHVPWSEGVRQKVTDILAVLSALTTVTAAVNPVFYGLANVHIRRVIDNKLTGALMWCRAQH